MSLTDREKAWLEERKNLCTHCFQRKYCRFGRRRKFVREICPYWTYPRVSAVTWPNCAIFEARVALKLANGDAERLKQARLAVEAEMEQEER